MKSLMIFCCTVLFFTSLNAQYYASTTEVDIPSKAMVKDRKIDDRVMLYTEAEEYPEFPGGEKAMTQYIRENLEYPELARDHGHEGTVVVQFVVETDGSVGQLKILRTVGLGCDKAAIAVFKEMPKWKPAYQSGIAVPVRYITPVKFSLF